MTGNENARRATWLAAIMIVQTLCAAFFATDVVTDTLENGGFPDFHIWVEAVAVVALTAGVVFMGRELRKLMRQMDRMAAGLGVARGELAEIVEAAFDDWKLTPAERDVALMILKGFGNEEIAAMRGKSSGTVRAQTSAIYAKAGVDGRSQLISIFLEELFDPD